MTDQSGEGRPDGLVKVLFSLKAEGQPDLPFSAEGIWCRRLDDGGFQVANIPFFAAFVALGDKIEARPGTDGRLEFQRIREASGEITCVVLAAGSDEVDLARNCAEIRDALKARKAKSEYGVFGAGAHVFSFSVPPGDAGAALMDDVERLVKAGIAIM
jgi:hypothetical protein